MKQWLLIAAGLLFLASGAAGETNAATGEPRDPATGLLLGEGWELARAHCGACHSYRLVTAQGGDEAFWLRTIRWMQRTQNLWNIPESQEQMLVRYLATAYPAEEAGRRPPLPAHLLP